MEFKFENLDVWKLAVTFNSLSYDIADRLPDSEKYNLSSQLRRSATSIALNIAEGSTGQSDAEQARFLSFAIRSFVEVVACLRLIESRNYKLDQNLIQKFEQTGSELFARLQAFRKALK